MPLTWMAHESNSVRLVAEGNEDVGNFLRRRCPRWQRTLWSRRSGKSQNGAKHSCSEKEDRNKRIYSSLFSEPPAFVANARRAAHNIAGRSSRNACGAASRRVAELNVSRMRTRLRRAGRL